MGVWSNLKQREILKAQQVKYKTDTEGKPLKTTQMEDETILFQLAFLTLFKLFKDWQTRSKTVPSYLWCVSDRSDKHKITDETNVVIVGKKKTRRPTKKIPENHTDRHPVQLLNEIRRGVLFSIVSKVGTSSNITFTIGANVDDKWFVGEGKTKKEATKNCVIEILKLCHAIVFTNSGKVDPTPENCQICYIFVNQLYLLIMYLSSRKIFIK